MKRQTRPPAPPATPSPGPSADDDLQFPGLPEDVLREVRHELSRNSLADPVSPQGESTATPPDAPWHLRLRHPFGAPEASPEEEPTETRFRGGRTPASEPGLQPGARPLPGTRTPGTAAVAGSPEFPPLTSRFRLDQALEAGGTGTVYRATDLLKEAADATATVAVKVITPAGGRMPALRTAVVQAVSRMQQLSHPNIVRVFDLHDDGVTLAVSMEWLEGESLAARLDRLASRPVPWPDALPILQGIVTGLSFAHGQGMVHGDLKPGNVFITSGGLVKLLDFGFLPRSADTPDDDAGDVLSFTTAYASPEVLEGSPAEIRDDVYALACLIYRLTAGRRPFGTASALEAERDRIQPARPAGLTKTQWRALRQGLAFRRPDRQPTVAGLLEAMTRPESATGRRVAVAAVVLAAVAGLFALYPPLREQALRVLTGPDASRPVADTRTWPGPAAGQQSGPESAPPRNVLLGPPAEPPADPSSAAPLPSVPAPASAAGVISTPAMPGPSTESATAAPRAPDTPAAAPIPTPASRPATSPAAASAPAPAPAPAPARTPPAQEREAARTVRPAAPPELPTVRLQKSLLVVRESDALARIPVRIDGELTEPIRISVVLSGGTALRGEDFADLAPFELDLAPGLQSTNIFVPLVSDQVPEQDKQFTVIMSLVRGRALLGITQTTVVIADDD